MKARKKRYLAALFCITILTVINPNIKAAKVLEGRRIILDAGHGGRHPGAVSRETGIIEKDANMSLTIKIARHLMDMGAEVIYTRKPGENVTTELDRRVAIANSSCADLFVSIHHDSSTDRSMKGVSTHYSKYRPNIEVKDAYVVYKGGRYPFVKEVTNTGSGSLIYFNYNGKIISTLINDVMVYDATPCKQAIRSEDISKRVVKGLADLGFRNLGFKDHNLFVTRQTTMPSLLIEAGFMSNKSEILCVTNPIMEDRIANTIAQNIKEYFISNNEGNIGQDVKFSRYAGSNRYSTNIKISQAGWKSSDYAILVSGVKFPDALSAGPLAKKYNAPIFLTEPNALNKNVESEIERLKVKTLFVIGGKEAVSFDAEKKMNSKGIVCKRIYGKDRYETAVKIANIIGTEKGVFLANGRNFPDALSIAPIAANNGMPILLTDTNTIPNVLGNYLKSSNINKIYAIGGEKVISTGVFSKLKNAERITGANRYKTNIAVLNRFKENISLDKLYIASGEEFADALSGSALASSTKSPIFLAGSSTLNIDKESIDYIHKNRTLIKEPFVLGGTKIISDGVVVRLLR